MKNYYQIEIDGQKVGLKFVYESTKAFLLQLAGKESKYWAEIETDGVKSESFTLAGFAKLIQCCYIANCEVKEVEPTLTFEDFYDYVEQAELTEEGQKELTSISEAYSKSTFFQKAAANAEKKSQVSL